MDARGLARQAARGGCLVRAALSPAPQEPAPGFQDGTTWSVTSLFEHQWLAFVSSEHHRPAEQCCVETVEHDRRHDQKLLDAQGEDEVRPSPRRLLRPRCPSGWSSSLNWRLCHEP
jgi:hypothetical protein